MIETTINGKTKDIVQDNIEQLKQLFPEIITEDKIDFDKLREILGEEIDDSNERYDFTWKGKHDSVKIALNPSEGTLRPDIDNSRNWDSTQNLYIEGNNLDVLKLLQKSYYGKIKMIYLDPPYNTGKDFIYEDKFEDSIKDYVQQDKNGFNISSNPETSGRYHTNWLNMMYPRLKIARNLLSNNGIIFISIDDNELFNLKNMLDEIFGEMNYLTTISRVATSGSKNDANYFIKDNDYILVYSKNISEVKIKPVKVKNDTKKYNLEDHISKFKKRALEMSGGSEDALEDRPNMGYSIYFNSEKNDFKLLHDYNLNETPIYKEPDSELLKEGYVCIRPRKKGTQYSYWRWSKETFIEKIDDVYIDVENKRAYTKDRAKDYLEMQPNSNIKILNAQGSKELKNLFEDKIFDFPKPVSLIEKLIDMIIDDGDIILDFFSGSGTTAHSVMNSSINKNIKLNYIMIQIPEQIEKSSKIYKLGYENICKIGEERIRRAGDVLIEENPNTTADIGFKVFKLDESNLTKWNPDVDDLENSLINVRDNIVDGRTELDLVYEIILKYGLELTLPVEEIEKENYTFYSVGMGSLVVCLNDHIKRDIAAYILSIKEDLSPNIMRVVFKDNGFESDSDKTNVKEILRNNEVDEFITI